MLHQNPFRPIRIELVNREVIRVPRPDFASIPPSSTDRFSPVSIVYTEKGNPRLINPLIVSSIEQEQADGSRKPRRRRQ